MAEAATVSGRVQVDPAMTDRHQSDRLVPRGILELAGLLALRVETEDDGAGVAADPAPEAVGKGT
jgi:hypothetical protein